MMLMMRRVPLCVSFFSLVVAADENCARPNLAAFSCARACMRIAMGHRGVRRSQIQCTWEFIMFYLSLNRQFILKIGVGCTHTHTPPSLMYTVHKAFLLQHSMQCFSSSTWWMRILWENKVHWFVSCAIKKNSNEINSVVPRAWRKEWRRALCALSSQRAQDVLAKW